MAPDGPPRWAEALVPEWCRAISGTSMVHIGGAEVRRLVRQWVATLADVIAAGGGTQPAAEVGAGLVRLHLTDPATLQATLTVLGRHLPPGSAATAVVSAVGAGYARELRRVTLLEQEQLARAIIVAYSKIERDARQSEARFRALFAGAAVGIGISDDRGRIVEANQALADMLGYAPDEMYQRSVTDMTHPSDPPEMWDVYARMARGEIDHVRMDKAYQRRDGEVVWTDLTVSLIRDGDSRPQFNVAMMVDVTERHHLQARLQHQAMHDPLTKLPNRTLFSDRLAEAVAQAGPADRVGVCYLDLDGFKRINDTLGHDVGDQLLVTIGERLADCAARHGCLAARMGGDEFVLLLERSSGVGQLAALADAALAAVAEPVCVGPHRLRVSASIGVVERLAAGARLAEILKAADVTLYRAKADGRGRWALYDPWAVAEQVASYELAAALPDALERGEFSLVYQPIVDLPGGRPRGLEALVRWHHPRLGTLTPDRFIGSAEETGLIVPLGLHVLREACREASTWRRRFPGSELFVSVNVAAAQTLEPSLVPDVLRTLADTGLDPRRLHLELTESALMTTSGAPLDALRALADAGIRVAIDDFGTGYSNLAYLRSLPVHVLKLPAPLIDGLRQHDRGQANGHTGVDEQIVDALIRLAHAIDLTVTAEGVETQAQADRLSALGCDSAQGWHIAPPCVPDDLSGVLGRLPSAAR